jgi:hypothetical protein
MVNFRRWEGFLKNKKQRKRARAAWAGFALVAQQQGEESPCTSGVRAHVRLGLGRRAPTEQPN